jgi:ABC-type microcin C transport system duplicated ATPase subunit YejF
MIAGAPSDHYCGKTTTGQAIYRLIPSVGGTIKFMGEDITQFDRARMRQLRRKMQVVYQDPFGTLNPRMTAAEIVAEPLVVHRVTKSKNEQRSVAAELLETVGLNSGFLDRYPHEFSGGQRQRLAIARALSVRPSGLRPTEESFLGFPSVSAYASLVHAHRGFDRDHTV